MRQTKFIGFGELAPDSREVDSEQLDLSVGLIPLYGEYRSMAQFVELSSLVTTYPVNGSHAHLVTPERSNYSAVPDGDAKDNSLTDWKPFGDVALAPEDVDDALYWWRLTAPVIESTGVSMRVDGSTIPNNFVLFTLTDVEDPNTDVGHYLRIRYRVLHADDMDAFSVNLALYEGAAVAHSLEIDELSHTGEGWQTVEETFDASVISDYSDLFLRLSSVLDYPTPLLPLKVPLVAVGNEFPQTWEVESDDDDATKVQVLQDGDVDTWIHQEGFGKKSFQALLLDVVPPPVPAAPGDNWTLFLWGVSPEVDLTVVLTLMEAEDEIGSVTGTTTAGTTHQEVKDVLLESEIQDIDDFTKLSIITEINATAAGADLTLDPNSNDSPIINFTAEPSGQIWDVVSDDDDGTWAEATVDAQFGCNLTNPAETPPGGTNVTVKAKVETIGGRCKFKLRFGDNTNGDLFTWTSGYIQNEEIVLSSGTNKPTTVDWPNAYLRVLTISTAVGTQVKVIEAWVETTGPSVEFEAQVSEVGLLSPTETAGVEVCFIEYDLPISKPVTPGDRAIVHAGNEQSLFEVSNITGFQDVSKTADASYGVQTAPPTAWEYCSWGNRVVAVNGSDPCQWQDAPGERFEDLLVAGGDPETEIFTARYCAVARDFLFLGNCLHPSDPTVGEYTVWWSDINNPRLFLFVDPAHLSDYQPLVTTSGAITGMTGGEFISIAKRTSMYRGTFVGPPLVWDIQVASYEEGTMYGSSLVAIDRDLFFFGSGGFRHLPYGSGVRPIGDGKISKMFTDKIYEDRALAQFQTDDIRLIQNAVVGAYDQWSRMIFWLYRGIADNEYKNKMVIVYNPWTDNWSVLDLPLSDVVLQEQRTQRPLEVTSNSGYSHANALPTLPTDDKPATRGWIMFGYTGSEITYERSLSTQHYPVNLKTKTLSSGAIAGAHGRIIKIHGIRFVTRQEDAIGELNFQRPRITATMTGALDVQFRCDPVQESVVSDADNRNENGWLMFDSPLPGEFFTVEAQWRGIETELLSDFQGFELDYEIAGKN